MQRKRPQLVLFFFCLVSVGGVHQLVGQSFDYHREESPAISWNGIALFDARSLATGGSSFLASQSFRAVLNPALAADNQNKITYGFSMVGASYEAVQYWGINQGVVSEGSAISDEDYSPSGISVSFPLKQLHISAGWYLQAFSERPDFRFRWDYDFDQYDEYVGIFEGSESVAYIAAALSLGGKLDLGLKLDYIDRSRELTTSNNSFWYFLSNGEYYSRFIEIRQQEKHTTTVLVPTIGAVFHISPSFSIGTTLVIPLEGDTKRRISRSFENSSDGVLISERYRSNENAHFPEKLSVGAVYRRELNQDLKRQRQFNLAAEVVYTNWSDYEYEKFNQQPTREMRNTTVFNFGLEYGPIFKTKGLYIRCGYRFDPQPVKETNTTLHGLSAGFGWSFAKLNSDIGLMQIRSDSNGPSQNHLAMVMTLSMGL